MPWTQDLSVGVSEIDNQHKKMFEMADALFDAEKGRKEKAFLAELFGFLDDYVREHFADEEQYMMKIGYPGFARQKKEHDVFIRQLEILKKEFASSGGDIVLTINTNHIILDWLRDHISKLDKKIGEYAKSKGL
jgi:hemerythrin